MRTIDIITTQKVTITYELASLWHRILAFLLDFAILIGSNLILISLVATSFGGNAATYFLYLFFAPTFFFYTLFCEIFFGGQSPGKKVLGIKVIRLDGDETRLSDYLIRWVFRMFDIYLSSGAIASLLISSSNSSQRLGGMLSNTTVIKLKSTKQLFLHDILSINSLDNYVPEYLEAKKLKEQDVLLIKSTLARYRRYPNKAHEDIINELTIHLSTILEIKKPRKINNTVFLNKILNDYVVLTR